MKISEVAKRVGKSAPYVLTIQKKFGLPACKDYPEGYVVLIRKLIYLTICAVPNNDIKELLRVEIQLLELLKADSLHERSCFRMNGCSGKESGRDEQEGDRR